MKFPQRYRDRTTKDTQPSVTAGADCVECNRQRKFELPNQVAVKYGGQYREVIYDGKPCKCGGIL